MKTSYFILAFKNPSKMWSLESSIHNHLDYFLWCNEKLLYETAR